MWNDYKNKVNEYYDKLKPIKSNLNENKVTMVINGKGRPNIPNTNNNDSNTSLAEVVSNALQKTYGNK